MHGDNITSTMQSGPPFTVSSTSVTVIIVHCAHLDVALQLLQTMVRLVARAPKRGGPLGRSLPTDVTQSWAAPCAVCHAHVPLAACSRGSSATRHNAVGCKALTLLPLRFCSASSWRCAVFCASSSVLMTRIMEVTSCITAVAATSRKGRTVALHIQHTQLVG